MRFAIWLKKTFDTPSFLVGDKVIVMPQKIKGVVTEMNFGAGGWNYYVQFTKATTYGDFTRTGWWMSGRNITLPYVEDLMLWDK